MHNLIEKNKDWLNFYSIAARIIGWMFIILNAGPLLLIPYMISSVITNRECPVNLWPPMLECLLGRLPLGIILLGVAQLIKYISEYEYKPPWLLRHGTFLLYLFAALALIAPFTRHWYIARFTENIENFSSIMILYVLPVFTKILVFIGLGNLLRRVLSIIEEMKTLV